METLGVAILCGLAAWRVASLFHSEDAFEWLRKWIGIGHDEKGYPIMYPETFWGNVFHCFWCLTLVVGAPVTVGILWIAKVPLLLSLPIWPAASSVAILLERRVMGSHSR